MSDIWVVTQSGDEVVQCNHVFVYENKVYGYCGVSSKTVDAVKLGEYMSDQEAKQAFRQLCTAISNGEKIYYMPASGFWQIVECCECGISLDRLKDSVYEEPRISDGWYETVHYCRPCWHYKKEDGDKKLPPRAEVYVEEVGDE